MRISLATLIGAGCTTALLLQATVSGAAPVGDAGGTTAPRTVTLALEAPRTAPRDGQSIRVLTSRATARYSLLGVSWDDPAAAPAGSVQVRTRAAADGSWSAWRSLAADSEDRPDPGSADLTGPRAPGATAPRGATAPLWVGPSDGVEVRVSGAAALPAGLRVELVDPGTDAAADRPHPLPPPPAGPRTRPAADHGAPRPAIVTRVGWGADESLREPDFVYTGDVRAVFVHHTDTGNDYSCADAPKLIRGVYQYHVRSNGWRDLGYNFLVDKCGTVYEGRAGGVARAVLGAHTLGFNTDSAGVAALGTYVSAQPPQAQLDGIAQIAAWKLGLTGQDARGTTTLVSANDGSRYPKGTAHTFDALSGHRDAFNTECPGDALFARLDSVRTLAAHLQGRQ